MAERDHPMTDEQRRKFLIALLGNGCVMVWTKAQKENILYYINIENLSILDNEPGAQLFIKNPYFSDCIFTNRLSNNIHMGSVYFLPGPHDDGHINIFYSCIDNIVTISYDSFFSNDGHFINPSPELKKYYLKMNRLAKKIAKIQ